MHTVIAIDGPSGVGKGTVARALAAALGYRHVDTGAMYRAVAWRAQQLGVDLDNEAAVVDVARAAVLEVDGSRVVIDGTDVSAAIRTPDIDRATTRVARLPRVRAELVARQRALAERGPLVMEGRDIGTVIMPEAQIKIFLTAKPESRADRRMSDIKAAGQEKDYNELLDEIRRRDDQDTQREACPLRPAEDAILLDNSKMDLEQTAAFIIDIAKKKGY